MATMEKVAEFIAQTRFESLPEDVVSTAKKALLDTLGVALAGAVEPAGRIITGFVGKMGGIPAASVIGGGFRTASPLAALANGVMGHALDYDDTGAGSQGHPSVPMLPAIFALAEETGASGRQVITAYAVGIEVWSKLSACMPLLHLKGWHPTAVFGAIGAAAGAANLLGLETDQAAMAVGLAASQAAGLMQNFGTMTKPFHAGNAAQNGVVAAMLAGRGFTADREILEGPFGFPAVVYGSGVDVSGVTDNLGDPFALASAGINVKKYPTCYRTHAAIDIMLDLVKKHDLKPEQIEKVDCLVPFSTTKLLFHTNPGNKLEAKFSMNFVLAAAVTDRRVGLDQVTDEKLSDPTIRDMLRRVDMRAYDGPEDRPVTVTVSLKDGKQYSDSAMNPRGHAGTPLSREELLEKYTDCAGRVLDAGGIARSIALLDELEKLSHIKELMDIVRAG